MSGDFHCWRCGQCCRWSGAVRVTAAEADAIACFMQLTPEEWIEKFTCLTPDRQHLSLIEDAAGRCIFLADTVPASCRIEPVKPQQCRDFPEKWNFPGWEKECPGGRG